MKRKGKRESGPQIKKIKKKDKVCIIGFAPSWNQAPFDRDDIDFWGINELYVYLNQYKITRKFSAWFEVHNIKKSPSKQVPKHQNFLKNLDIPLITQQHWPEYPTSIAYPRKEVKKMVDKHFILDDTHSGFSDYSNQISWMIALAIYLGYKEIFVYGVDMAQASEYCLSPNTKILMQDLTYKKALDLKFGDEVIGFEENFDDIVDNICLKYGLERTYRKFKLTNVEDCNMVTLDSYKLKMSNGDELICSKDHRWLIKSNSCDSHKKQIWKTAEELKIGDVIIKPLDVWETQNSYDAGYLAAAFDGEGYLTIIPKSGSYSIGFSQNDNAMLNYVINNKSGVVFNKAARTECINLTVKGGLPEILKTLGSIRPKRLLDIFESRKELLNQVQLKDKYKVSVVEKIDIGKMPLMSIKTTEGTLIANGYASHNSFQRASCQFFLGFAAGKNIKLWIPNTCELLKAGCDYGFESDNKGRFNAKKRIEGHNNTANQVKIRMAEIKYFHDKLDKELDKKLAILDDKISIIGNEIKRIILGNDANKSVVEFLQSMPNDFNTIMQKKGNIINQTQQIILSNENQVKELDRQLQELIATKDKTIKDVAINHTLLDEEYEANKTGLYEIKGNIKAHEHNLSNNLV